MKKEILALALSVSLVSLAAQAETTVTKSSDGTTTTTVVTRTTDTDPRAQAIRTEKEFSTYAYSRWDKNADGIITPDEWESNVVTWYGPEVTTYKTYAHWDKNHNGKLDPMEFDRVMNETNLYDTWNVSTQIVTSPTINPAASFGDYDLNADGTITQSEWEQVHKK